VREELLRAMLNADLIGFLLFEYTRNFLACCKRLLGAPSYVYLNGFFNIGSYIAIRILLFFLFCCDLLFSCTRNFLACCKRLLGAQSCI